MNNRPLCLSLSLLFTMFVLSEAYAENRFRLLGGIGTTKTSFDYAEMDLFNHHYGAQFVHYVAEKYAYGLEIVHHQMFKSKGGAHEYLSVCIVLEAMLHKIWLNQMGIAGYIGTGDSRFKPFGFRSSTGLDIPIGEKVSLSILSRSDLIFEDKVIFSSSLEAGMSVRF
ncbi:MAG: hypothetical protein QME07_06780 [bacterium]|nr:hypothetical protein [bacterium]